jgi:MscS family membrane protein
MTPSPGPRLRTLLYSRVSTSSLGPAPAAGYRSAGLLQALLVVLMCLLPFGAARAQSPLSTAATTAAPAASAAADVYGRTTPQSSVFNFLEACRAGDFRKASRYLDLRDRKPEDREKNGPMLARQLAQILDHDSQFDLADLSNDPAGDDNDPSPPGFNQLDAVVGNNTKVVLLLERITTRSGSHVWVISADSLKKIPALAAQATETPTEKRLPTTLVTTTFLDTPLWQWLLYLLVIAALAAASGLLSRLILAILGLVFRRFPSSVAADSANGLLGPLRLLVAIGLFRAALELIGGSVLLRLYFGRAMTLLLFVGVAWLSGSILDGVSERVRARLDPEHRGVSHSILPLLRMLLKIGFFVLAVLATLTSWGYNTTTLLAGLGVGGLAVALAAQKTLENFFGGISVITDRPVLVGDACRFGTQGGVVEEIGLRSTRIRTDERTVLSVPNAQFSTLVLENLSARDRFLFRQTLRLRRDASAAQIRAVVEGIAQLFDANPKVDPGALPVRFVALGEYAHRLDIVAYVKTRVENEFLAIQAELLVSILAVIEAAGTSLAVPVSETINVAGQPEAAAVPKPTR